MRYDLFSMLPEKAFCKGFGKNAPATLEGGGGWSPVSWVSDAFSSAGDALASIDPGPAIGDVGNSIDQNITQPVGDALASVDKFMTNLTPYGWALPAAIVAAYFTGGGSLAAEGAAEGTVAVGGEVAADGTVFAAGETIPAGTTMADGTVISSAAGSSATTTALQSEATQLATNAGQNAYQSALASGASEAEAQAAANAAAQQAAANYTTAAAQSGASQFSPEMIQYANASGDPIGTLSKLQGLTPEEFSSVTQYIGGPPTAGDLTAGQDLADLMKSYPDLSQTQLEDILKINYSADPTVAADAANLAKNGYDAATINQVLGYSYTPTELAGTGVESFAADSTAGLNAKDVLSNVNRARQLANLLSAGGSTVKAASIPTAQQWTQNAQTNALNQPAQQQFGGLYEMNKNPFTFQNPLAGALAGNKPATGLDVSGTPGTALNTGQQNQIYSSLLRSA